MFGKKKEIEVPIRAAVPAEPIIKTEEAAPAAPAVPEEKPVEKVSQTVIAEGTVLVGNFDTREPMLLLGKLQGNIHSTDSLKISKTGSILGEAAVSALSSDGQIEGTVLCSNLAEFGSMARMKGNLSTASLKTADGSAFEGSLTMITKAEPAEELTGGIFSTPEYAADLFAKADAAQQDETKYSENAAPANETSVTELLEDAEDAVPINFDAEDESNGNDANSDAFTDVVIE